MPLLTGTQIVFTGLVKFPMEIYLASTDDPWRVWRPWQEPSACPRTARIDAGASRRTKRRPRYGGQPDRGRQAGSEGFDGAAAGQGCGFGRERLAPQVNGPAPFLPPETGPARLPLLVDLQQRHDCPYRRDLHPAHLPPLSSNPVLHRDGKKERRKKIMTGGTFVTAQSFVSPRGYARALLIDQMELDRRGR